LHRIAQRRERGRAVAATRDYRLGIDHRIPDRAELRVDAMDSGVKIGRSEHPHRHDAVASGIT
jgi:hypothetical protein